MPSPYPAAVPRRMLTVSVTWLALAAAVVLTPLLVLLSVSADVVLRRKGWPTSRMVAFIVVALWIDTSAQVLVLWTWVSQPFSSRSWTLRNHDLMHWWVARLTRGAERVVGLRLRLDVPDDLGPGPLLAFSQHVSIIDAVAPAYILGTTRGWFVRYTLTRGLRFDPCLDIVGHRIPNYFVARGAGDNTGELANLRTLVGGMEHDEGAVIFPGGGLFTPAGLARAVEKLTERGSAQAAAASAYRHVMPPRPGGVQAFFDGAPGAHVIVVGHVGFEPLASIRRLWDVLPLVDPVDVKIWRYERSEVPEGEDERLAWLYEKWKVMDDWIDDRLRTRAHEAAAVPA